MKYIQSMAIVTLITLLFINVNWSNAFDDRKELLLESTNKIETFEFYPTDDATIDHDNPDAFLGSDSLLKISPEVYTYPQRTLEKNLILNFDYIEALKNYKVKSAKILLYYTAFEDYNPINRTLSIYKLEEMWNEDNVTWNTRPKHNQNEITTAVIPNATGHWMEWNVTEDILRSNNNFGWLIKDKAIFHINMHTPHSLFHSKESLYHILSPKFVVTAKLNHPPENLLLYGQSSGKINVEYEYTFSVFDPDGDDVYYFVQWGGGCPTLDWIGPYPSDEEVKITNSWGTSGTFNISAIAKDSYGLEGDWNYLEVNMPYVKRPFIQLLERLISWFIR